MKTLQDWKSYADNIRNEDSFAKYYMAVYPTAQNYIEETNENLDEEIAMETITDNFDLEEPLIYVLGSNGEPHFYHIDDDENLVLEYLV